MSFQQLAPSTEDTGAVPATSCHDTENTGREKPSGCRDDVGLGCGNWIEIFVGEYRNLRPAD